MIEKSKPLLNYPFKVVARSSSRLYNDSLLHLIPLFYYLPLCSLMYLFSRYSIVLTYKCTYLFTTLDLILYMQVYILCTCYTLFPEEILYLTVFNLYMLNAEKLNKFSLQI